MSGKEQQLTNEGAFDHTSPRPPVIGEEKSHFLSDWGMEATSTSKQYAEDVFRFSKPSSPLPKRNLTLPINPSTSFSEMTGSSCRASSNLPGGGRSPPPCLRWAHSLHALLQDGDGVKLFRQYLESEGKQHSNALDFWFACEGLRKQQGVEKIMQLVKLIYKKFFVKSQLPVPEEVRKEIGKIVKSSQCLDPPVTLFDQVQAQIEHLIVTTTYPNFLKSEMYLQYVENVQSTSSSGSSSDFSSGNDLSNMASGLDPLPTLHEDMELIMNPPVHMSHTSGSLSTGHHTPNIASGAMRLTKDVLLLSQNRRAVDLTKSETFANDGRSLGRTSRRQAALNREVHMNQVVIPRTQWVDKSRCVPMEPHKFASMLIEKLEMVKKDRDTQELLEKKLRENDTFPSISDPNIREKLLLDDENDQSILDDHVSLVFPDTPARSPGITSPHKNRHLAPPPRRRKDGSVFSNDSGNVHDFADGSEHKFNMVKSKSMPEYPDERFVRGAVSRRSSSKKTLADQGDSGVSVVSDSTAMPLVNNNRVLAWLMSGHNDMSVKQRSGNYRTSSATSPISNRHKKGFGSRSSSVERNSATGGNLVPAQPFVADPSKPPMQMPNTLTQLEEARRRLEDNVRTRSKQRSSSNRHFAEPTQSSQSTLRKSQQHNARPSLPVAPPADEFTIVVFSFCEEQFPYRTKIPGAQITLKQFKDYLPKKGNYRYFFKTVCEELGNQVIQEEVSNDSDILPLWEGKIMAQVKPID
ncbi:axin-1 isoform X2 [Anthonomus grandis grandis]|uniref:axin-1 isoform X2 n=1 Tax=Anthonomus grandis grandis TaxID=2921223 RepID=UPI002165F227|nr:axin-1 isoform X2 [Anthonomus grandis grandis]